MWMFFHQVFLLNFFIQSIFVKRISNILLFFILKNQKLPLVSKRQSPLLSFLFLHQLYFQFHLCVRKESILIYLFRNIFCCFVFPITFLLYHKKQSASYIISFLKYQNNLLVSYSCLCGGVHWKDIVSIKFPL